MVSQGKISERVSDKNWFIYVLELVENKYYVGIAVDPEERFLEHKTQGKKCSGWCRKHKALKIIKTVNTGYKTMKDATIMEDIVTLEYIKKYGAANVRGGRYSGSESRVQKSSEHHIKKGYITIIHKIIEEYDITYQEIEKMDLKNYLMDTRNESYLNNLIRITSNFDNPKKELFEKLMEWQNQP